MLSVDLRYPALLPTTLRITLRDIDRDSIAPCFTPGFGGYLNVDLADYGGDITMFAHPSGKHALLYYPNGQLVPCAIELTRGVQRWLAYEAEFHSQLAE